MTRSAGTFIPTAGARDTATEKSRHNKTIEIFAISSYLLEKKIEAVCMNFKIQKIIEEFKREVASRYKIIDIKLFGSSARGDSSNDSDIDIMVRLSQTSREIEEELFDIAYDLELKYDCLIDVIVLPKEIDMTIPLYANIEKEGVTI
jgi:uncharacterized protein